MALKEEYADLFRQFVINVRLALCGEKERRANDRMFAINIDYDPLAPENRERAMHDAWNSMASIWAAVESEPTYHTTMAVLTNSFGEMSFPSNRMFRTLSLGSGPGLYEIFLAYWMYVNKKKGRIFSLDYSEGMVEFQKAALAFNPKIAGTKVSAFKDLIVPTVGDMTDLTRFHGMMDLVICNNSLQWVADWRKVLREISLVMNPEGEGKVIVIIHSHAMRVRTESGVFERALVTKEQVLDEAEKHKLQLVRYRSMHGAPGTGQGDDILLNRMILDFQFKPEGISRTWRVMRIASANVVHRRLKR